MSIIPSHTLHPHVKAFAAGNPITATLPILITANDGTGDAVAVTGQTIDTLAQRGDSIVLCLTGACYVSDGETFKALTVELQESSDDSTWDTAVSITASETLATGTASANTFHVKACYNVDLRMRKRYIRFNYTPDLSSTAGSPTDFATISAIALMTGCKVAPVA